MISDGGLGNQPQEQNARSTGKCTGRFVTFSKKFSSKDFFINSIISCHSVQRKYFQAAVISTCPFPCFDLCTTWNFGENLIWKLSLRKFKTTNVLLLLLVLGNKWWLSYSPYQPFSHILLMHAFFRVVSICFAPYPTRDGKQSPSHCFRTTFYIIAAVRFPKGLLNFPQTVFREWSSVIIVNFYLKRD